MRWNVVLFHKYRHEHVHQYRAKYQVHGNIVHDAHDPVLLFIFDVEPLFDEQQDSDANL